MDEHKDKIIKLQSQTIEIMQKTIALQDEMIQSFKSVIQNLIELQMPEPRKPNILDLINPNALNTYINYNHGGKFFGEIGSNASAAFFDYE